MATTHVFIVNEKTFKVHLEYMFVGTGGSNINIDFNGVSTSSLTTNQEKNVASMMADACRIRQGDKIIFYLRQQDGKEGQFFGIFRAKEDFSFIENYGSWLSEELGKALTFRSLIEPDTVYSKGISEWNLLDDISKIDAPYKMIWSLIYRKLKGNRGNTMITQYEAEMVKQSLSLRNTRPLSGRKFTFNTKKHSIETSNSSCIYSGLKTPISIFPRMKQKYDSGQAYEAHLQTYIVQNIEGNTELKKLLLDNKNIEWLGNEVSCGVGMQRIDVLSIHQKENEKIITPIELKATKARKGITRQLKRYVDWLNLYFIPNIALQTKIQPVIIAEKYKRNSTEYRKLIIAIKAFNRMLSYQQENVLPIKYIEFFIDNDIHFNKVDYDN